MTEPLSDDTLAEYEELSERGDLDPFAVAPSTYEAMNALLVEVDRLKAENAALRLEIEVATAALERQAQASFIADMRTKALEDGT